MDWKLIIIINELLLDLEVHFVQHCYGGCEATFCHCCNHPSSNIKYCINTAIIPSTFSHYWNNIVTFYFCQYHYHPLIGSPVSLCKTIHAPTNLHNYVITSDTKTWNVPRNLKHTHCWFVVYATQFLPRTLYRMHRQWNIFLKTRERSRQVENDTRAVQF